MAIAFRPSSFLNFIVRWYSASIGAVFTKGEYESMPKGAHSGLDPGRRRDEAAESDMGFPEIAEQNQLGFRNMY